MNGLPLYVSEEISVTNKVIVEYIAKNAIAKHMFNEDTDFDELVKDFSNEIIPRFMFLKEAKEAGHKFYGGLADNDLIQELLSYGILSEDDSGHE
jgi:hypothetical protein